MAAKRSNRPAKASNVDMANASMAELIEIQRQAKAQIEKRKDGEIQRLRDKWTEEAADLDLTPEIVLGLQKPAQRVHRTTVFSPIGDDAKAYKKGPYPHWLKDLLQKHGKKNVSELVELGVMRAKTE